MGTKSDVLGCVGFVTPAATALVMMLFAGLAANINELAKTMGTLDSAALSPVGARCVRPYFCLRSGCFFWSFFWRGFLLPIALSLDMIGDSQPARSDGFTPWRWPKARKVTGL